MAWLKQTREDFSLEPLCENSTESIMSIKIYTKTGDKGSTSLIGGTKVLKSDLRIEAYGTVDELNSFLGLVNDQLTFQDIQKFILRIQDRLFTIGSSLACDPDKGKIFEIPELDEQDISSLEVAIDLMSEELLPMKNFVLPGGHVTVSTTHVARSVCRRTERICVHMQEQNLKIDPLIIKYLNRLSDYLFILARFIAHKLNVPEIPWKPREKQ